jgi:hypothetical protein
MTFAKMLLVNLGRAVAAAAVDGNDDARCGL